MRCKPEGSVETGKNGVERFLRRRREFAAQRCLVGVLLTCACGSGGAGAASPGSGGQSASGGGANSGGAGSLGAELVGRWWGFQKGGLGVVLEVPAAGSGYSLPVRIWNGNPPRDTSVRTYGSTWTFDGGGNIQGCPSFALDADGESLLCEENDQPGPVLHRSHATRIHATQSNDRTSAPSIFSALGLDASGARFAFGDRENIWLWDSARGMLGELGKGELSPVLYSSDGRHVAYLRLGPTSSSAAADLMLFDAGTGESRLLASGTPTTSPFAQFSADGTGLVFAANDAGDGTGIDIVYASLIDDSSAVIAKKIQSVTHQPYVVFGASGRDLVFGPESAVGVEQPLARFDVATQEVTDLGAVNDLAASPDGSFLAFADATGQIRLWDDHAGSTRVLFKPNVASTNPNYRSGLTVSPDGRRFAFLTSDGRGNVYDTAPPAGKPGTTLLGTGGIECYSTSSTTRPLAVLFAPDSSGAFYWSTQLAGQSDCYGGATSPSFGWLAFNEPAAASSAPTGDVSTFGPHGEVLTTSDKKVKYWSPSRGTLSVLDLTAEEWPLPQITAAFTREGNALAFSVANYATSTTRLLAWDAAAGSATELTSALKLNPRYQIGATSGQVAFSDDPTDATAQTLKLWTPGSATPQALLDAMDGQLVSNSGKAFATHGKRGTEQGIFAFRFGDSQPTLIEEGRLLAISDTQLFFQALDGVFVQAY